MVNVAGIEHQITECPGPFVAMGQGCEKKRPWQPCGARNVPRQSRFLFVAGIGVLFLYESSPRA